MLPRMLSIEQDRDALVIGRIGFCLRDLLPCGERHIEVVELRHCLREVGNRKFPAISQLCMIRSFKQPCFTEAFCKWNGHCHQSCPFVSTWIASATALLCALLRVAPSIDLRCRL